jgi:ubiquinone/menaquinone biosynthesis C-methylase UbiE
MYPSPLSRPERIEHLAFDFPAQTKQRTAKCNLSGANDLITITHVDRYGYPAAADLCRSSGLVFLNPVMTQDGYTEFYKHTYRPLVSAFHNRLINAQTIQEEQRAYAAEVIEFVAPAFKDKPMANLLDIGGSTGVVAMEFVKTFGCKATVVDPAPDELAFAGEMGLRAMPGFIEDVDVGDGSYDFVMICQSIDHLLDVDLAIMRMRKAMTDDGVFFIDIVDFRAAYLRNGRIEGAIKIDHPYYFTRQTIEAYLRKHGLRVERMNFAADHLHIGFLCRKCEPVKDFLPDEAWIESFIDEIRQIQNTPLPPRHG